LDPTALLERVLDQPTVARVRAVLEVYGRAPGGLLANGLAFAALFAVVPIALVTLGLAGWLVDDPRVQAQLAAAIGAIVPPLADLVDGALDAMSEGAALSSIVGVVGVIWTVSQFYSTLDIAFSRIFTERPERDVLGRTWRGFVWVAGLVVAVIALIVAGAIATAAEVLLPASATALIGIRRVVTSLPVVMAIGVAAVLVIYRVVPSHAPSWRAIRLPALVGGVAIVLLSQLFLFAAPRIVAVAAFAGSLATAFVALAWLSFTFQILLLGAAWVRVRDDSASAESALPAPAAPTEPGVGGQ
jgi:membrane protein